MSIEKGPIQRRSVERSRIRESKKEMSLVRAMATAWALYSTFLLTSDNRVVTPREQTQMTDDRTKMPTPVEPPKPPQAREKPNHEREALVTFAEKIVSPTSSDRPKLFDPTNDWKARCNEAYSLLSNNQSELVELVIFLSRHTSEISDPELRRAFESTLTKFFGVTIPAAASQSEKVHQGLKKALWWIQGCSGIVARKAFSDANKFENEYPRRLSDIVHAIVKASQSDPKGTEAVRNLAKIVRSAK